MATGNQQIDDLVAWVKNNFGIDIDPARAAGWAEELDGGEGRDYTKLRTDVLHFVVGDDTLKGWIKAQFSDRGLQIGNANETEQERLDRLFQELTSGSRTFKDFTDALDEFKTTSQGGAGVGGTAPEPSGMFSDGVLTRFDRSAEEGGPIWAMVFSQGGVRHVYTFDSYESVQATFGDPLKSGGFQTASYDVLQDPNSEYWLLGAAEAFAGQSGTYAGYFDTLMAEAALEAGVRDPGAWSQLLRDPAVQRIIAEGEAGGWSPARIKAEIRRTDYYQNVLYPGISNFFSQGTSDPEGDYMRYLDSVDSALGALGYERDGDGTYKTTIAKMLDSGIKAENFNAFAPVFIRAEQSQEFANVLGQWTQRDLGKALDFDNWFDVLAGEAAPDIADVVEKATIQFQAERFQTSLGADQISRLASLTDLSEAQIAGAFSQAEESLLSVGQEYLTRYGLSEEALVNAAFGVETGQMTANDVRRQAGKAATELGIADDSKAQFFVGFDRFSRPVRTGLAASRPEAG